MRYEMGEFLALRLYPPAILTLITSRVGTGEVRRRYESQWGSDQSLSGKKNGNKQKGEKLRERESESCTIGGREE